MLRSALNVRERATALVKKIQVPERFRGTVVDNWARYWRGLVKDYGEVFSDAGKSMRERPAKACVYAAMGAAVLAAIKLNPPQEAYRAAVIQNRDEVALVAPSIRNPAALAYVENLERLHNECRVRHVSLGVLSLYWEADESANSALPRAQCEYLQPAWLASYQRIIEVGFWRRFWKLESQLVDFDVNPAEWQTDA